MGIGGVENESEYEISLVQLERWLCSFANRSNYLQHNAQELKEFLLKSVLPFKERWFFPGAHDPDLRAESRPSNDGYWANRSHGTVARNRFAIGRH